MPESTDYILAELRARITPRPPKMDEALVPHGLEILKGPPSGPLLGLAGVHEVLPDRPGHGSAIGFVVRCLAARLAADPRPVLWAVSGRDRAEEGRLYGPGLAQAGLDPGRLITVLLRRDKDMLWVLEQALISGALAGVAGSVRDLALTPSRRLSLAADRTGTPLFLMRHWQASGATAAETRWQVAPLPSAPDPFDAQAPGRPIWQLSLTRNRRGPPTEWQVLCKGEKDDAEDALGLAATAGHGALAPGAWGAAPHARTG